MNPKNQDPEFSSDGRSIIYNGETVRLSKIYPSYEAYVADPQNIDASENHHILRLMTEKRLPQSFKNRSEALDAAFSLKFPGYGSWSLQTQNPLPDRELRVEVVEIPRADKARYVAIAASPSGYRLIDDFVAPMSLGILFVRRDGEVLTYGNRHAQPVLTHKILPAL